MNTPLDEARAFLHEVVEILHAGNAENATVEERELRDRLCSPDSNVYTPAIERIIASVEENTK